LSKPVYLYPQVAVKITNSKSVGFQTSKLRNWILQKKTLEFDIAATDIAAASEMADYAAVCRPR